ncbi:MAG: diacylglycerol kinase family lipid kinase [Bacillota bacterium]
MKSYKFIVNPKAGGGRAIKLVPRIKEIFTQAKAEHDFEYTSGPGDAIERAARASEKGFDIVVAVGGDGTVNEVLNGIAHTDSVLAALRGGKGNDFAIAVNMPSDIETACQDLLKAKIKRIDLGKVLDRHFINSVGVGFDATVALRVNKGVRPFKGVSAYIYAFFLTLFSYKQVEMEIDLGNGPEEINPLLVAVGIGSNYGGGMKILPGAIQDDGLFDICILDWMDKASLAYNFPKVFNGSHVKMKQVTMNRSEKVILKTGAQLPLHMEGEILFGDEMNFTIEPGGMPVLIGGSNK